MADSGLERTERPTPKRLEDARRRGQVPRSVELNAAAVVLIAASGLYFFGSHLAGELHGMMRSALSLTREQALDETRLTAGFSGPLVSAGLACLPVLGLTLLAALLAPLSIGGWNVSTEALAPNFSRLSPIAGLKRMFAARSAVELGKAFAKFGVVAAIAVLFLWRHTDALLALGRQSIDAAVAGAVILSGKALFAFAASLALIAAADVPWQLWQHTQQLRMTRQEVREEFKESEGSPEIRSRIRAAQMELARRRMMQEVPTADVVVVNPTHFAVALRYDERRMRAPVVVAKGADEIAARIREVATEHLVPIFEAPPLARALYRSVEIGGEVPGSLYVAVAQVLTYVYQLRTARRHGGAPPQPPSIDPSIDESRR